jgi:predicted transcriptional regulator
MTIVEGRCDNPRCSCVPCTCEECRCGGTRLGDLERRVMDVLWSAQGGELTGREVADHLPDYAYTTVATVLDRLSQKGEVRKRSAGGRIRFAAVRTGASHAAQAMREALGAADDVEGTLADFVARMAPEERRALRRALQREASR